MGVKYRKEAGAKFVSYSDKDTHRTRKFFTSGRTVTSQEDERELASRRAKQFMVKGRIESGRMMWDVFLLDGDASPRLQAAGFAFQAEAIAFARDRALGRLAVSFTGVRGMFKSSSSGLAVPSRGVERAGSSVVSVKASKNGTVLVG